MKKILLLLSIVILVAGCSNQSSKENDSDENEKVTFKLSTPDPDTSPITIAAKEFADVVEDKSEGSIIIDVHPNGTLYGEDPSAAVKQLGSGSLDLLLLSTSLYANFEPRFNAVSIPYLFDNDEQFLDYLNSDLGNELIDNLGDMGIKGLELWPREFRQITNSVRPITEPKDLDGVKLRVPNNPLWVEFFQGAGTVTTPMDFGEVYNALQLGTIHGQENPIGVVESSKMYEVQEYLTISNHMAEAWVLGVNNEKFEKLTEEQQTILIEAADELQNWKYDLDKDNAEQLIGALEDEGMKVNELTEEQQGKFVDISKKAYPEFEKLIGNDEYFQKVLEFVGKE